MRKNMLKITTIPSSPGFFVNILHIWLFSICWRREWHPTPVFLRGEFHGQKKVGYSPWGGQELEMPELLTLYVLEPQQKLAMLICILSFFPSSSNKGNAFHFSHVSSPLTEVRISYKKEEYKMFHTTFTYIHCSTCSLPYPFKFYLTIEFKHIIGWEFISSLFSLFSTLQELSSYSINI